MSYTDDTAMTLVLTEHLISQLTTGADLDEDTLIHAFAAAWRAEPWRGYGAGPTDLPPHRHRSALARRGERTVRRTRLVRQLRRHARRTGRAGRPRPAHRGRLGPRTAQLTHTHPLAQAGAVLQATAVALALTSDPGQPLNPHAFLDALLTVTPHPAYTDPLHRIRLLLNHSSPQLAARHLGNGVSALESVPLAILAFLHHPNRPDLAIRYAIRAGGDTDTTAAMAGAITAARTGRTALPAGWLRRLEHADRITRLADDLAHTTHGRPHTTGTEPA